jgi:hypothetical protein
VTQPERHHYVPAFYLAEFADPRDRYGNLRVFDVNTGRTYGGKPDTVAFERHFYRVETDDPKDALILEHQFAELEGKGAPIIRTMNDSSTLPNSEDLSVVLALVAFQAVRVPAVLDKIERFQSDLLIRILDTSVALGPEAFREQARKINPDWTDADIAEIKQDLTEFLRAKNPSIKFDQTSLLRVAIQGAQPIGDALIKRHWSLAIAPPSCPLITSDNPIVFQHSKPGPPPLSWTPAFGRSDTTVVWPTGPGHALMGAPYPVPSVHTISEHTAAQLNTLLAVHADERVYFGGTSFRHFAAPDDVTIVDGPTEMLHRRSGPPTTD